MLFLVICARLVSDNFTNMIKNCDCKQSCHDNNYDIVGTTAKVKLINIYFVFHIIITYSEIWNARNNFQEYFAFGKNEHSSK